MIMDIIVMSIIIMITMIGDSTNLPIDYSYSNKKCKRTSDFTITIK